jgi:hypothetical protein
VIDRLSRWQTPVVVGAVLLLVVAASVEGEWRDAAEYALMAAVVVALREGRSPSGSWTDGLCGAAFALGLVGAPVALVANAVEGSWLRAVVWAIVTTGLVLVWLGRRGSAASAEPVTQS